MLVRLLPVLVLCLLASPGLASSIGPVCGSCQGGVYSLVYGGLPAATTASTETFEVTLFVDASGYDGGGTHLDAVAVKASSSLVDARLVSGPAGVAWTEVPGGLSADGCSDAGSGFHCAVGAGGAGAPVPAGTLAFVFWLEIPTGTLFTGTDAASIKVRYTDGAGNKVGALVSENVTLMVPEPATALLFAGGLASLALARRRR